jgi:hypothetical protein
LPSLPDWDELRAAAIASNDEHVIKLVHACTDHSAAYGEDEGEGVRRATATRALAQAP